MCKARLRGRILRAFENMRARLTWYFISSHSNIYKYIILVRTLGMCALRGISIVCGAQRSRYIRVRVIAGHITAWGSIYICITIIYNVICNRYILYKCARRVANAVRCSGHGPKRFISLFIVLTTSVYKYTHEMSPNAIKSEEKYRNFLPKSPQTQCVYTHTHTRMNIRYIIIILYKFTRGMYAHAPLQASSHICILYRK